MKSIARKLILTAGVTATLLSAQSCMKDTDSYYIYYPNAIVTVKQVPGDTAGCYLQLDEDGHPLYMTVEYQNGYATSTSRYPAPSGSSAG